MSFVGLLLQAVISILLIAGFAYGLRLHRKLDELKGSQTNFVQAVGELDRAAARAEAGLASLRESTEIAHEEFGARLDGARTLAKRLEAAASDATITLKRLEAAERRRLEAPPPPPRPAVEPTPAPPARPRVEAPPLDWELEPEPEPAPAPPPPVPARAPAPRPVRLAAVQPPRQAEPPRPAPRVEAPPVEDDDFGLSRLRRIAELLRTPDDRVAGGRP